MAIWRSTLVTNRRDKKTAIKFFKKTFKNQPQQRHLLKARHYREIRDRAFEQWTQTTCAQNLVTNN